jgi:hypothetical protein
MNFYDWLDTLNLELEITRYPNQENRFCASIKEAEFKDYLGDGLLQSLYGDGTEPSTAIVMFSKRIEGKVLVLDKRGKDRITFTVPKFQ